MAATYTPAVGRPVDRARKLLGDTGVDGGVFLLEDEEILLDLGTLPFNEAVAQLALGLAARFGQYPDEIDKAGGKGTKWTKRVDAWFRLADEMRNAPSPLGTAPRRTVAKLGKIAEPANSKIRL